MQDYQITVPQAMSALNVTRLTVYNQIKNRKLRAEKTFISGRAAWLINKNDIDALITKQQNQRT